MSELQEELQEMRDEVDVASEKMRLERHKVRAARKRLEVINSPQMLVAQARALNMLVPVHASSVQGLYSHEQLPPEGQSHGGTDGDEQEEEMSPAQMQQLLPMQQAV